MPDDDGESRLQAGPRSAPRARLLACFAFALSAHAALLASQSARARPVASRRSAGGLQAIQFDECPPELPHPAPPLAATVPAVSAARRHRDAAIAISARAERARDHDEPSRAVAPETTNPLVGLPPGTPSLVADGPAVDNLLASVRSGAPHSRAEHGRPHGPRLLTAGVCGGLFPSQARDDEGAVIVALGVRQSGTPYEPRVISETPLRQGFAGVALRCASLLKFAPAENAAGAHVSSTSVVRLRFARGRTK
jgi:hypothetical protein